MAAKKSGAKKAGSKAKKAPAKKAPVAKATGKKASAAKAPVAKATGKKASAAKATGKKASAKKAAVAKAPAKKAPVAKAPAKKASVAKAPAKKASVAKAPDKRAAPKERTVAVAKPVTADSRAPAAAKPKSGFPSGQVNMGHIFALRPRVPTSFRQDDFRSARHQLAEEFFKDVAEAARAVAEKALELTHHGVIPGRKKNRGSRPF